MTVTSYFWVWNFQRAISMVIPRSRSAFNLSNTQAYLKEPLPSSLASYNRVSLSENYEGWADKHEENFSICPHWLNNQKKSKNFLPSRTSQWYGHRYHRTCRSSDLLFEYKYMAFDGKVDAVRGRGRLTGGGRLSRVDVADDHDVNVTFLFLTVCMVSYEFHRDTIEGDLDR